MRIRTALHLLVVAALASIALVTIATPGSAGSTAYFTVNKVVKGTAPGGTTFTIHYVCTGGTPQTGDFTFNATGSPIGGNQVVSPLGGTVCTFTETGSGGADNTDFNCVATVTVACSADNQVTQTSSGTATITVTNAYSNALGPVTVSPSTATAGQTVTVSGASCTKDLFGGSIGTGGDVEVTIGFPTPIVLNTTAAGTTGAWSVQFTVPAGTSGPYTVSAICDDPVPYAPATVTVATTTAAVASAVETVPTTTG